MTAPPLVVEANGPLARANPAAKLIAVLLLALGVFVAIDPVTAAVVLAAELVLVPLAGLTAGRLIRRMWPALFAAAIVGASNAVFGTAASGATVAAAGPVEITTGGLLAGLGIGLRVLAIALPGVLVLAVTDPTDLADSLVEQLRVPVRFAVGALAALRLIPLLVAEWETLGAARRARGLDAGGSPLAAVRLAAGRVFALLVGAIRRGTRLATAMDARGFDSGYPRTAARPQHMSGGDWALIAAAVVVGIAANLISAGLGTWQPLLG